MKSQLVVSNSPHIISTRTVWALMLDVIIALIPAFVCSIIFFGYMAAVNAVISIATCVAAEYVYTGIVKKTWNPKFSSITDLSAVVTGLLLALNVPTAIHFWQLMLAAIFAIVAVKMLFGGIGKNFVNPALMGRIFLLVAFAGVMGEQISQNNLGEVSVTATWLGGAPKIPLLDMFLGKENSSAVGETSKAALLIGGIYLIIRKVIDWKIPLVMLTSAALFALLFFLVKGETSDLGYSLAAQMLSGGLILGAFFMATDYATSPNTTWGTVVYAAGIGFFTMTIRSFSAWSEGLAFAIVIMNALVPLIDKYMIPKTFGGVIPKVRIRRSGK